MIKDAKGKADSDKRWFPGEKSREKEKGQNKKKRKNDPKTLDFCA